MAQQLQIDDIQGFVLRGYSFLYARYLFLQFKSAAQGRQWLGEVVEWTTPATVWKDKPKVTQNLAFTYQGLAALGMPAESLKSFSKEFIDGMHTRSRVLGDTESPNCPEEWELGNPTQPDQQIHALLLLFGATAQDVKEFVERHEAVRQRIGSVEVAATIEGFRRMDKKEHFGYLDGASQPLVEGSRPDAADAPVDPNSPVREIKAGEFVLGYVNEYGVIPPSPFVPANDKSAKLPEVSGETNVRDFGKNGTYIVCRKLQQNVAAFREFLQDNVSEFDAQTSKLENIQETEWLAAKLVGRWRSGAPMMLSPDKDDALKDKRENNDFTFDSDPDGLKCPIGSHIRRSNPRDTMGLPGAHGAESFKAVNRHRILRRGMPYGTTLQNDKDDGQDRGLVFLCVNADIAVQYEFVQRWMNDPSFNGLYQDQDVFAHNHADPSYANIPVHPVRKRVAYKGNFVTMRGGAYMFMPSMTALRYLASM
ncbi:MAG: Dyp-type peroxidase [Anaerolineae bacterium]